MRSEDFENLKARLGDEFELLNVDHEDNEKFYVIAKKKGHWEGAEFLKSIWSGKVYPAGRVNEKLKDGVKRADWEISTENDYIEQLKKEAQVRFGEIKEGDRFDITSLGWKNSSAEVFNNLFEYRKHNDEMLFGACPVYKDGKWATKVKERVKVELTGHPIWTNNKSFGYDFCFHFRTINGGQNLETHKAGKFLAQQLEKYLNK